MDQMAKARRKSTPKAPRKVDLRAANLTVGSPVIGASKIRESHPLNAVGITTQPPVFAKHEVHHLEPGGLPKPVPRRKFQTDRIDVAARRLYPPDGRPPDHVGNTALTRAIGAALASDSRNLGIEHPSVDAVRRWRRDKFKD
jgi:hypothetical protein